MPKVGEVMARDVVTVAASASIVEVALQISASGISAVAICDDGKFKGMISERDIVIGVVALQRSPDEVTAGSVVSNHQWAVSPTDDIWYAARLMEKSGNRVLPVVERRKLVGLFSLDHLARESPAVAAIIFTKTAKLHASKIEQ